MATCKVDGCENVLSAKATTGLCRSHNHAIGYCECFQCRGKIRKPRKPRAPRPELIGEVMARRCAIRALLRIGLGVEDIHVEIGYPLAMVREYVAEMRKDGMLVSLYR